MIDVTHHRCAFYVGFRTRGVFDVGVIAKGELTFYGLIMGSMVCLPP